MFSNFLERSELIIMEESVDDRLRMITKESFFLSKVVFDLINNN